MKNIVQKIILVIFVLNCYVLSAQIQREQLVGNWVFDYDTSMANMPENAKTILLNSSVVKGGLESTFRNRKVTFNTDGSYFLVLIDGREMSGTWNLSGENNNLITITTQNQIENISVLMLTNSGLVLKPEGDKVSPFFLQWYFTKI